MTGLAGLHPYDRAKVRRLAEAVDPYFGVDAIMDQILASLAGDSDAPPPPLPEWTKAFQRAANAPDGLLQ